MASQGICTGNFSGISAQLGWGSDQRLLGRQMVPAKTRVFVCKEGYSSTFQPTPITSNSAQLLYGADKNRKKIIAYISNIPLILQSSLQ